MTQHALPAAVLDLLARSLASMEQIETLLLLLRHEGEPWTAEAVARELQIDPTAAAATLDTLVAERLVTPAADQPHAFQYGPSTAALGAAVDELAVAYNTRPVTLIKALYARPPKAATAFADAFRLRPPNEER